MNSLLLAFGSRARGEADYYSDNDLLEITPITPDKENSTLPGVLSISHQGIVRSSLEGSLFLKHVFDEGQLLAGSPDDLYSLKRLWRAKTHYEREIEENRDLLPLLEHVPQTNMGMLAAVDIIICALRSILIRRLAQEGVYLYSWTKLAEVAARHGLVHPSAVRLIQYARRIKNRYRSGEAVAVDAVFLRTLLDAALPSLGVVFLHFDQNKSVRRLPEQCPERTYKQLRAMELVWTASTDDPSTRAWLQWIRDPRSFSPKCGY